MGPQYNFTVFAPGYHKYLLDVILYSFKRGTNDNHCVSSERERARVENVNTARRTSASKAARKRVRMNTANTSNTCPYLSFPFSGGKPVWW